MTMIRTLPLIGILAAFLLLSCENTSVAKKDGDIAPGDGDTIAVTDDDEVTGDNPLITDEEATDNEPADNEPTDDPAADGDDMKDADISHPDESGDADMAGNDDTNDTVPSDEDITTDETVDGADEGVDDATDIPADNDTVVTDDGIAQPDTDMVVTDDATIQPDTDTTVTDDAAIPDVDVDTCECTTGACCDGCHFRNSEHVCRAKAGECDNAETCTGGSAACPGDGFADLNDPCDDNVYCNGADVCDAVGGCTVHDGDPCGALETCVEGGGCLTECQVAEAKESYVGCEYWGAYLQNLKEYAGGNYAVVVANPNDTDVTVTVYGSGDVQLSQFTVAPGLINSATLDISLMVPGAGISDLGLKFVSSRPVTITQMNPFGNVLIYTNDASLLLPKGALGYRYYAMSWPTWSSYPGLISVVAVEPGTTSVTVTYAGASRAGTGVTAQAADDTVTYSLVQYQILTLNSADGGTSSTYGPDLTGSFIQADKKIALFGGHECTNVPVNKTACDHLEHQIFPLRSWGKDYVAVRTKPRGTEADYFRILASVNDTHVSWSGGLSGSVTLDAGAVHDLSTTADFTVTADHPVMVAQVLASQDAGAGTGDPAMMLLVPDEQMRQDYIFLVAPNYDYDRVTIVAPPETDIMLDETPLDPANAVQIPGSPWYRYYIDTTDGAHTLAATKPVALYVYGFSQYVSYAYTAGLDLSDILKCWDTNQNGLCDPALEDHTGDGICTEKDCM